MTGLEAWLLGVCSVALAWAVGLLVNVVRVDLRVGRWSSAWREDLDGPMPEGPLAPRRRL